MTGRVWAAVALAALGAGSVERRTVVRAASDAVLVDVSVRQGRQPVAGLERANFVLKDNGVVQPLDDVATEVAARSTCRRRGRHERKRRWRDAQTRPLQC